MSVSPLRWVGGKFLLSNKVAALIPKHKVYVEPFGGAAHLFFVKTPSKVEVYNDIDSNLVNFWKVARDQAKALIEIIDDLPYSREYYHDVISKPLPDDPLHRAAVWFYILQSSFSAKYASRWSRSKIGNHAAQLRNKTKQINFVKKRFSKVLIENRDFREIFSFFDSNQTFFYVDPPYYNQRYFENYYKSIPAFSEHDHRDLAKILANLKGKFILSGYPSDLYSELYSRQNFSWIEFSHQVLCKKEVNLTSTEILIGNFDLKFVDLSLAPET